MSILRHDPRRVAVTVAAIILIAFAGILREANAQSKATQAAKQTKQTTQKDEYHRPDPRQPLKPQIPSVPRQNPNKVFLEKADSMVKRPLDFRDRQIVTGNVQFRQMGMWMFCDSAYYFPEENSLDAFGHVKMQQGDTLFVYADKVFYDGTSRFAKLRNGPSEPKVRLINRKVSLTTDSLDYSLIQERGWYTEGGVLKDEGNTLRSQYGSYSPATKEAEFFYDVVLDGSDNDFHLYSDTLYYNTATHIASIVTRTRIITSEDEILTNNGFYNTQSGVAELMSRSTILHTDSLNRTTTLEGDSIVYDPVSRISQAFRFRDPTKRGAPMIITDTARKATLIGGYGYYNDLTREAMASSYPLLIEYSRGDTLFLRADTILTRLLPYPERKDSIGSDSIGSDPARMVDKPVKHASQQPSDSTWHYAIAYPRARFFRSDIQGVADTIIFTELDSIIRMKRLPVAWNEERQVRGDSIIVHLNDSTADWARIPGHAKLMEHVEEDYYDQLHADQMRMWFENGTLKRLEAEGSVATIMLPQESDSTYNRLVNAESSFLNIDMEENDLKRLKMWPEVTGTVTPLFLVKKSQKLLPGAMWLNAIRPKREWYEGGVRWDDELGEIPMELEDYFNQNDNLQ
ncbi:MAG: hypothetical protein K2M31_00050 [Muribaculaceae bacterium]|nr:hypothetical protein [Muribaculaceae bacterium]